MKFADYSFTGKMIESYQVAYVDFKIASKERDDKKTWEASGRLKGINECLANLIGREAATFCMDRAMAEIDKSHSRHFP